MAAAYSHERLPPTTRSWQHEYEPEGERRSKRRSKKKPAKEIVIVEDGDEEEGQKEKANLPT